MYKITDAQMRNLGRLRKAYVEEHDPEMLLENTMLEIQEILEAAGIDWTAFEADELLEE